MACVGIIDYGCGNLFSVRNAVEKMANVILLHRPEKLFDCSHIILPGVGSFTDAMGSLTSGGWVPALKSAIKEHDIPLLGICLGMQMLFDYGYEGTGCAGLGLISGEVRRMEPELPEEKVPHVGWNEIHKEMPSPLLNGIEDLTDFYFVHSYRAVAQDESNVVAWTPYCRRTVALVHHENIIGTQFHPEKSGKPGYRLLQNFISY